LNVFVPVNVLLFDNTFDNVVYVESAYDFVISCVLVVGVTVDVGKLVLNVFVIKKDLSTKILGKGLIK
jgi:hypothetical protein